MNQGPNPPSRASGGIGLGLSGPLSQQTQRFPGRAGNLLFDVAQILFGVMLDDLQTRLQVLAPGLQFRVGEFGFGHGGGRPGGRGQGRSGSRDLVGQALVLLGLGLAGLADFDVGSSAAAGSGGNDGHRCLRQGVEVGLAPRKRSAKRGCRG